MERKTPGSLGLDLKGESIGKNEKSISGKTVQMYAIVQRRLVYLNLRVCGKLMSSGFPSRAIGRRPGLWPRLFGLAAFGQTASGEEFGKEKKKNF